MSDERKYTERDIVLAKREGFLTAARVGSPGTWRPCNVMAEKGECRSCEAEAANHFPLPKVERPRVVKDGYGREWSYRDGSFGHHEMHYRDEDGEWINATRGRWIVGEKILSAWTDLFQNPTELVEDDGGAA